MPDTLVKLESDRSKLLKEFLRLGDLRPGPLLPWPVDEATGTLGSACARSSPARRGSFRFSPQKLRCVLDATRLTSATGKAKLHRR